MKKIDEMTIQVLNSIRKYESENDTNLDVNIAFGHYVNELTIFGDTFDIDDETDMNKVNIWVQKCINRVEHYNDEYDDYDPGYDDDSDRNCASCPPSECSGHCFSCAYRSY